MSWFEKLTSSLGKTSAKINSGLSRIFSSKIEPKTLQEFSDLLITADVSYNLAAELIEPLKKLPANSEANIIKNTLQNYMIEKFTPYSKQIELSATPTVLLFCGVNGNGKTTVIGKLASRYTKQGKKVLIAACDTFRAAANQQLAIWAQNAGADFVSGNDKQDPASVAFNAVQKAYSENYDLLLIDTAGRLHNKLDLMAELAKIMRVIRKVNANAPHYNIMVVDGTTGNNALAQFQAFNDAIGLDALVVNKLDGTAKGGMVFSLLAQFHKPIFWLGIGEKEEDLLDFSLPDFVHSFWK